ncbi:MAG: hypothetical protein K2I47_07665 [Odoribacter sp.]|nr:hypothetical protein [Odoribacter sp.]
MKTNVRRGFLYMLVMCFVLALASCGRSGKNKVKMKIPQDSAVVIEEESVVVEVDTLVPDSTGK